MCYPTSASAAGNNKSTPKKVSRNNRLPLSPASTSVAEVATNANTNAASTAVSAFTSSSSSSLTRTPNTNTPAISIAASLSPSRSPNERVNSSPQRRKNHSPILKVLFSALFVNEAVPSPSPQASNSKKKHPPIRHVRRESRDDFDGVDDEQSQDSSSDYCYSFSRNTSRSTGTKTNTSHSVRPIQPRVLIYQKEEGEFGCWPQYLG